MIVSVDNCDANGNTTQGNLKMGKAYRRDPSSWRDQPLGAMRTIFIFDPPDRKSAANDLEN